MLYRLGHAWSTTCHHRARDGLGAARVMRHFFPGGLPGAVSVLTSSVILPASAGPLVSRPCVPKAVTPRLIAASLRAVHLAPVAVRADVRHLLAATAVKTTAIRVKFVHGRYPAWTSFTASAILVSAGFVPGRRGSFFFSGMAPPLIFPQSHQPTSRTRATMIPPRFLSLLFQTPECRGFYPPTTGRRSAGRRDRRKGRSGPARNPWPPGAGLSCDADGRRRPALGGAQADPRGTAGGIRGLSGVRGRPDTGRLPDEGGHRLRRYDALLRAVS